MVSRLSSESQTRPPGLSAATRSKSRSRGDKLFRLVGITELRYPPTLTGRELMGFLANDQSGSAANGLRPAENPVLESRKPPARLTLGQQGDRIRGRDRRASRFAAPGLSPSAGAP